MCGGALVIVWEGVCVWGGVGYCVGGCVCVGGRWLQCVCGGGGGL